MLGAIALLGRVVGLKEAGVFNLVLNLDAERQVNKVGFQQNCSILHQSVLTMRSHLLTSKISRAS